MLCLEIYRGTSLFCLMGIHDASMLSVHVGVFVGDEFPAILQPSGLCDLPHERVAHVYWVDPRPLACGDALRFSMVESDVPSPPSVVKPTDSEAYLQEMREYDELMKEYVAPAEPAEPAERRWPNVAMKLGVNGEHVATAALAPHEEHILCSVHWDKWRPERLRICVRSFAGGAALPDSKETEWLNAHLGLGETFELTLAA